MMKAIQHFSFLTALIPFFLFTVDLPPAYKSFWVMIWRDINLLLSDSFDDKDIDELTKRIIEMKCCYEGMFPISECQLIIHFLIHLAPFIKKFGPVRGWWEFAGERAHPSIKQFLPKGGRNTDFTLMSRYLPWETSRTRFAYDSNTDGSNRAGFSIGKTIRRTIHKNENIDIQYSTRAKDTEIKEENKSKNQESNVSLKICQYNYLSCC